MKHEGAVGFLWLEPFPSIQHTQIQVVFSFSLPKHHPQVDKDLSVCPKLLGVVVFFDVFLVQKRKLEKEN